MEDYFGTTTVRLGKIDPATGIVTTVSPYSISKGGYALNAGSTIDPSTMIYYYNNGDQLVGVSLLTGLIVSQPKLNNVSGSKYFDLMRIQSNCIEAVNPLRLKNTTSIKSDLVQSKLNIYPNPADDGVNISCSFTMKKVEIFNLIGEKVSEQVTNSNDIEISLLDINSGSYYVKCTGFNNQIATQKLLII